MRTDFSYI